MPNRLRTTIPVKLGRYSYAIHLGSGLLNDAGHLLDSLDISRTAVVISSADVLSHQGERLFNSLRRAGFTVSTIVIPKGEEHKNLDTMRRLYLRLSKIRASRRTIVVAFGGGVVGDVAGFAAATYLRGLPCVQIPTTLLAQIDSSIGGKTGVNLPNGKNLVGAFYQPKAVLIDPLTLQTLPDRQFQSGMFEAVKYSVIRSASLFSLIETKGIGFPRKARPSLIRMISECAQIKAEIVSHDEREAGLRMILNYGHTLGHALEAATNYQRLTHGEAIGHGMIMANQLAQNLGKLDSVVAARINHLIRRLAPITNLNQLTWSNVFRHMLSDKKFVDERLQFVLPRGLGSVEIVPDVPAAAVRSVLRSYLNART